MEIKKVLLSVMPLLLVGCFSASKPEANIHFNSFRSAGNAYLINFGSDIKFDSLFPQDASIVIQRLICSLEEDQDFSVKHRIEKSFRGHFELDESASDAKKIFNYSAVGDFYFSADGGTSQAFIKLAEVRNLLSKKDRIPCKAVMTIYFSNPYYSKVMYVPSESILSGLDN